MIEIVLYSYKNKNLKLAVDHLISNTQEKIFIHILDKNNIKREDLFTEYVNKNIATYEHIFWDEITGVSDYRGNRINGSTSEYFLCMSDDILVSSGWDKELINFLNNNSAVLSGSGKFNISMKDQFSFNKTWTASDQFLLTNFIDRNFIFAKTEILKNMYPVETKYYGDEELLSLNLFRNKTSIFSVPSSIYTDLKIRTLENKYVPFSLEHNYNLVFDEYQKAPTEFLSFHNIDLDRLSKLPYNANDVSYNPYLLDFQDIDARKFIDDIRSIS